MTEYPLQKILCHVYWSPAVIANEWSKPTSNMADTVDNISTHCVVIWTKLLQEYHSHIINFEFLNFDIKWTIHYMYNFENPFWLVNILWQVKWKHLFRNIFSNVWNCCHYITCSSVLFIDEVAQWSLIIW